MKILKWLAIVLVVLVLAVVGLGLALSKDYALERSVVIDAPPERVHVLVGDLARWDEWAPWKDADPTIVTTLGETTTGVGATQTWTDESGGGWLTFTRSDPATGVSYDMAFLMGEGEDAEEMPSTGALDYERVEGGTRVTWSMRGSVDVPVLGGFLARMLPSQVGPMFDAGLQKLDRAVAALPPEPAGG